MNDSHITQIEWAPAAAMRPRAAGYNARLQGHGLHAQMPLARITTADGARGFGFCRVGWDEAAVLLGQPADDLLKIAPGEPPHLTESARPFEFPLWDLLGQRAQQPVYKLVAQARPDEPLCVPCYDTSLYIDDLHLDSDEEAAALIANEALEGRPRGHTAFKIKVGRGGRHMPLEQGTRRDIAVIRAVRDAVGPAATLMIDANNGYNLNLAKRVLAETADCRLFWLEEAFHEDRVLYEDLREWLDRERIDTLIADGEGEASPNLLTWAQAGVIDVVQYDIFSYGFSNWLHTGAQLDGWNVRTAPHHYGRCLGNYVSGHLATAIDRFTFVEWDEAASPLVDASAYRIERGHVVIPDAPGFGLHLNEDAFQRAVAAEGFALSAADV
jgi:L-alanine-DL-glutamate epimerase-like enolase superfamily enzyme